MIDMHAADIAAHHAEALGIPSALVFCLLVGESEFNLWAVGDQGKAAGGLQVRVDVHGGTLAHWQGYEGLHRSFALMGPRWQRAWQGIRDGPAAWERDPLGTLITFWINAQGANADAVRRRAPDVLANGLAAYEEWRAVRMATIEPPPIRWIGAYSGNFEVGRRGYSPEAVAVHTMGGTLRGCDSWFNDPQARVSAHFGVGRGRDEVHQYVRVEDIAFANGIIEPGYRAKLIDANGGVNPNYWTVSIEHDDLGGTALPTDNQLETSARLTASLFARVLFDPAANARPPVDAAHIIRHGHISPRSRPNCPGWPEAMLNAYIARVAELVAGPAPAKEEPNVDYNTAVGLAIDAEHGISAFQRVMDATRTLDDAAAKAALRDARTALETAERRLG